MAFSSLLRLMDNLFTVSMVAALVISYWRGCWLLLDLILYPDNPTISAHISLAIGSWTGMVCCLMQERFSNALDVKKSLAVHLVGSRVYTAILAIACVNHWRGVSLIIDVYTGTGELSGALTTVLGLVFLCISRSLRNVLAPPFSFCPDKPENYFLFPTLFGAQESGICKRLLDAFFTVVIIESAVVIPWRGAWLLLDLLLIPSQPALSAIVSMAMGLLGSLMALLYQCALGNYLKSLSKGWRKIILEDLFNIICFLATVNVWRGVWLGFTLSLLTVNPLTSNLLTTVVSQVLLIALLGANSLLNRGALMDGSDTGAGGITLDASFISYFRKQRWKFIAKCCKKETKAGEEPSPSTGHVCDLSSSWTQGRETAGQQEDTNIL